MLLTLAGRRAGKHARSEAVIALQQRIKAQLGVPGAAAAHDASGLPPPSGSAPAPTPASEFEAQRAARGDAPVVDDSEGEEEGEPGAAHGEGAAAAAAGAGQAVDAKAFAKAFKVRWRLCCVSHLCNLCADSMAVC